jgi:hypothetical protein
MKFRKLYWVTEQLAENGQSSVVGVFTSMQDLRTKGLKWNEECDHASGFRVSLVKLDHTGMPLGDWSAPGFDGIESDLAEFVETGEMDEQSVIQLAADLRAMATAKA